MTDKYKATPGIEVVTWIDHFSTHTDEMFTLTEIAKRVKEDCVNRNVGFLAFEDEAKIILAHEARVDSDLGEATFGHYTGIYKGCILDRHILT